MFEYIKLRNHWLNRVLHHISQREKNRQFHFTALRDQISCMFNVIFMFDIICSFAPRQSCYDLIQREEPNVRVFEFNVFYNVNRKRTIWIMKMCCWETLFILWLWCVNLIVTSNNKITTPQVLLSLCFIFFTLASFTFIRRQFFVRWW